MNIPQVSVECERGVLGSLLLDGARIMPLCNRAGIIHETFMIEEHRQVFRALDKLYRAGAPIDLATAVDLLRKDGRLEEIGGTNFLTGLVDATPTAAHGEYYIARIRDVDDRARIRALLAARMAAVDGNEDAALQLEGILSAVQGLRSRLLTHGSLVLVPASDWLANEPPAPNYAIEGFFEIGDRVLLVAPSKCRKSFAALQLAVCLAAGRPFFDLPVPTPRRVLVANLENRAEWQARRLRTMCHTIGIEAEDLGKPCRLATMNTRGQSLSLLEIGRAAEKFRADVVVIDPTYAVSDSGDEMDQTARREMLAAAGSIAAAGRAVVLVQHDPKGQAGDRDTRDRGSGSNLVNRAVDATIALTPYGACDPDADFLAVVSLLARNAPPRPDVTIRFTGGAFIADPDRTPIKATSRNRGLMNGPKRNLNELVPAAVALVQQPVSPRVLKSDIRSRMRLSKGDTEDLLGILCAADGPLVKWDCGTFPQTWLVGTASQRDVWQKKHKEAEALQQRQKKSSSQNALEESLSDRHGLTS